MSGFDENPFGEPTVDNPFAVSDKVMAKSRFVLFILLCHCERGYD